MGRTADLTVQPPTEHGVEAGPWQRADRREIRNGSSELFRMLVEGAKDYAIFMLDPAGFVVSWNEGAARIKGYAPEEILGRHFSCFYRPEDIEAGLPARELVIAQAQGKYEEENWRRRKDGSEFFASVVVTAIYGDDGRLAGFSKLTRDVTERKRAEGLVRDSNEQLTKRSDELTRLNAELEAFTSSVAHDLRAPLRHLAGFADLLHRRNSSELNAQGRLYLGKIQASARLMGMLIDDLLTFSKLGRCNLKMVPIDLAALVLEVQGELDPETEGRRIEWLIGDLPPVFGDPNLVRVVLTNLLSNAIKYTRGRTETRIEIGSLEPRERGHAVIFVRDNGVGFEMEYAGKLFEVFQRLHSDEFEGNGVGLASVRRIVERHGGRVWATAVLDEGASFCFSLPAGLNGTEEETHE